ncbi:hypothetical protein K1719_016696 [Acacia pycnantha]|nr:hypothetical protein K1719_016696 [Acacia pycnantha]
MSIIGRLNHMNLIEMWGYCAEGNHRLLVYEFMEKGSLADNLKSNTLDWTKRYNIALGIARVLAYLYKECLEWILHCDIKPQNILLDSNYQPKVADFGSSKLLNRRRSPTMMGSESGEEGTQSRRLVTWVREKIRMKATSSWCWVEQIIDPAIVSEYEAEKQKMETLAKVVALECVEQDREARPTLSEVVEMLQSHADEIHVLDEHPNKRGLFEKIPKSYLCCLFK